MSDYEILGWIIAIVGFSAGFSLGHLRGQMAGIKWCRDTNDMIDKAFTVARSSRGSGT